MLIQGFSQHPGSCKAKTKSCVSIGAFASGSPIIRLDCGPFLQATYWKCLKPFVEMWGFDPYATPFTAEEALLMQPLSPGKPLVKPEQTASPSARPLGESQLLLHKSGHSVAAGSLDVSRALQRSKLAAQRQQVRHQTSSARASPDCAQNMQDSTHCDAFSWLPNILSLPRLTCLALKTQQLFSC